MRIDECLVYTVKTFCYSYFTFPASKLVCAGHISCSYEDGLLTCEIFRFKTESEVVELANNARVGLAGWLTFVNLRGLFIMLILTRRY